MYQVQNRKTASYLHEFFLHLLLMVEIEFWAPEASFAQFKLWKSFLSLTVLLWLPIPDAENLDGPG